jgi:hypothetical protein
MKKLIAIATLGLTLGFSSLSLADSYVFGVKVPVVKNEVKNNVKGGEVEKDFISFYTTPKTGNTIDTLRANQSTDDDKDYIVVFGVRVPVYPRI